MTKTIKFHYFHGRGIGEPVRLLLTIGGVAFNDQRYTVSEFSAMDTLKQSLPFGQMPGLEVDGVFLGQADSVTRLAARLADLYPADLIDAARSDMIVLYQAEIQSAIAKMSYDGTPGAVGTKMAPKEIRRKRIDAWMLDKLPEMFVRLENLVQQEFFIGSQLSWADVCVFNRLNQLFEIDEEVLRGGSPKIQGIYAHVAALPAVRTWMRAHKEDYPRFKG